MAGIIDFHTHAFPDRIAAAAIPTLEREGNIKAFLNGTIASLLDSMDRSGIDKAVICSIATSPAQYTPILAWSKAIRSERIIPLPSLHPADPHLLEHLHILAEEGFPGIKMHSYYQDYTLDDPALDPLHQTLSELGLVLVIHAGYDIAFPRIRRADPRRIVDVCRKFPDLKLIATHLGGWDEWDDVERLLIGKPIYMELSFAADTLDPERLRRMLLAHPPEYLMFGSDSPWTDQSASLERLRSLDLSEALVEKITSGNASRLLGC